MEKSPVSDISISLNITPKRRNPTDPSRQIRRSVSLFREQRSHALLNAGLSVSMVNRSQASGPPTLEKTSAGPYLDVIC